MSLKNRPNSSADTMSPVLLFGVSSLHNASLLTAFYPEDLPQDWRLSYYSNEFNLLLLSLDDLLELSSQSEAQGQFTAVVLLAVLTQLCDELDENFTLLFDISSCGSAMRTALQGWQKQNDFPAVLSLLDMVTLSAQKSVFDFSGGKCLLVPKTAQLLVLVNDGEKLSALALRALIDELRDAGLRESAKSVMVFFSAQQYALENTRNAVMLESMM